MNTHYHVANLLCQATIQVLHKDHQHLEAQTPLSVRVGSGRSTYHKHNKLNNTSLINYGARAVFEKIENKNMLSYGTAKEIQKYKFFDGKITSKTLLVAVVLHEYAHYIQVLSGYRAAGSVHNEHFYCILKELYSKGYDKKVLDFLNQDEVFNQIEERNSHQHEAKIQNDTTPVNVGDFISFNYKGREITEQVNKVNRVTVSAGAFNIPFGRFKIVKDKVEEQTKTENKIHITQNSYVEFFNKRGEKIVAKVTNFNGINVSCSDGKYKYRVPVQLIKRTVDKKDVNITIKDRNYFSHLQVGDKVRIQNRGKIMEGIVKKLNPQKANCVINGIEYGVPYSLILE